VGFPHSVMLMEFDKQKPTTPTWRFWLVGGVFAVSAAALLLSKLFFYRSFDWITVTLFLIIWIPFVLPFVLPSVSSLKFGDFELKFIEGSVQQVQEAVTALANQTEIERDENKKSDIKVDPYEVRLKYTSQRLDARYSRVRVWLDAPKDFIEQVDSVVFERHPTFKNRFKTVRTPPFEDRFKAWGEFTIRAEIKLKNGVILRRQRYLASENPESEIAEDA